MLNNLLCHLQRNFWFNTNIIIKRFISKNYYDVLKLSKNCTRSEIRNAFLKLSKEYHPDRNNDKNSHAKYVQILEAYKVLSKPQSKYLYDLGLANSGYVHNMKMRYGPTGQSAYTQDFWQNRDRSRDKFYEAKPYYGVKGINKLPNWWIVLCCLTITTVGVAIQVFAIRHASMLRKAEMEMKTAQLEELHARIRAQALENGNEIQLQILKERFKHKG